VITRLERRQQTETRILEVARQLFTERGFERTTIRAIADGAGVDPALVMQYFGSKDDLFRKAVVAAPAEDLAGDPDALTAHLLELAGVKLGDVPQTSLAAMRSMLTHPETAERIRTKQAALVERIAAAIPTDDPADAELRAALIVSILMGISVERQLLEFAPLRDAPAEQVVGLLRPVFDALARVR
jgi:AcrR family transcriptional regulator